MFSIRDKASFYCVCQEVKSVGSVKVTTSPYLPYFHFTYACFADFLNRETRIHAVREGLDKLFVRVLDILVQKR